MFIDAVHLLHAHELRCAECVELALAWQGHHAHLLQSMLFARKHRVQLKQLSSHGLHTNVTTAVVLCCWCCSHNTTDLEAVQGHCYSPD